MELIEEPIREFVIRDIRKPAKKNLETDIDWFCKCLGFMEPRDKEKTAIAIFKEILNCSKDKKTITSLLLMKKLRLSRGITVYYLNKFLECGLIRRIGNQYELRERNIESTINEIEKDLLRVISNIKEMAIEIDERLKMPKR